VQLQRGDSRGSSLFGFVVEYPLSPQFLWMVRADLWSPQRSFYFYETADPTFAVGYCDKD